MANPLSAPIFLLHLPQYMADLLALSELSLAVWRRSGGSARSQDRGSLYLLWVVITLSVTAAIFTLTFRRDEESVLLTQLVPAGVVLFVSGLALRWWSIFYLGRFFTVNVAIAADHRVVDTGPYRWIRHPSYTGMVLMYLALGICCRNWHSLQLVVIPTTAALMWRIHVEEKALLAGLGDAYANYTARTRRLIPFVY